MLKRWFSLCGLVVFVLATMTAPAYAQTKPAMSEPACHEMMAETSHAPVKSERHDCDTACHCPVSQGAVADAFGALIAAPLFYPPLVPRPENATPMPSCATEGLLRPPRLNA